MPACLPASWCWRAPAEASAAGANRCLHLGLHHGHPPPPPCTPPTHPPCQVWNPWVDKSKAMADFGDDEYQGMLCIEPAVAGSGAVTLAPGKTWAGRQLIIVKKLV